MSAFKKGDSVLIVGSGPIGLATILALKARGADKIIISEIAEGRKQFAKVLGAHYVLDPSKDNVVAKCRESMITKKIKLDEVEEQGFHTLINDKANQVKVLVEVAGGS